VEQPKWTFGVAPLPDVVELAEELRELTSVVLALETAPEALRALTEQLRAARTALARDLPADLAPRIGPDPDPGQRVYMDHSRDVGDFNPCFPLYSLAVADDRADGEVEFPLCYEGPPGIVHGGFLAVFFDLVLQQLNCDLGVAGKTVVPARQNKRLLESPDAKITSRKEAIRLLGMHRPPGAIERLISWNTTPPTVSIATSAPLPPVASRTPRAKFPSAAITT